MPRMRLPKILQFLVLVAPIITAIGHIISAYSSWNASNAQNTAAAALLSISRSQEALTRSQEATAHSIRDVALSFKQAIYSFVHGQFVYRFVPDPIPEPSSSHHEN